MRIGLFFGSFNPIHNGHLAIAQSVVDQGAVDKVRFIVSPQSPFKQKPSLAHPFDRLDLVRLAIEDNYKLEVSNIEFDMPTPNYTIDTMNELVRREPEKKFVLIVGEDNLESFQRWKKADVLLKHFEVLAYRRTGSDAESVFEHPNVEFIDGPVIDLSASFLRSQIKKGYSIEYLVPSSVSEQIKAKGLYL